MNFPKGPWEEYANVVMDRFNTIDKRLDKIDSNVQQLQRDIDMLKVKAGIWGLGAGAIPVSLMILIKFFIDK